jgi:hypothetical protein
MSACDFGCSGECRLPVESPDDDMDWDDGPFVFRINDNGSGPNLLLQVGGQHIYIYYMHTELWLIFNWTI